jgi:hypothetical protein
MGVLFASIVGDCSRKLYHFTPLDSGEPLPFPDPERNTYLRVFTRERRPGSFVSLEAGEP